MQGKPIRLPPEERLDMSVLDPALASDIERSIQFALDDGSIFEGGSTPLQVFRHALARSIAAIETRKGDLLRGFLDPGPVPGSDKDAPQEGYLSDTDTAAAVNFIFGGMMNHFKGVLAELLAARPLTSLVRAMREEGKIPPTARLYMGDTISAPTLKSGRPAKGADVHVLTVSPADSSFVLHGVGEVKSYRRGGQKIDAQLEKHALRARQTLFVHGSPHARAAHSEALPFQVRVRPGDWRLSRRFQIRNEEGTTVVVSEQTDPQSPCDDSCRIGESRFLVTLRWSEEALEDAAYGFTFWYMEILGETLFLEKQPRGWDEMTPRNATQQSLYAALMRLEQGSQPEQKAIALYNSYGYGYAIGMNFRSESGRRQMLFFEDLVEIAKHGFSILPPTTDAELPQKRFIH